MRKQALTIVNTPWDVFSALHSFKPSVGQQSSAQAALAWLKKLANSQVFIREWSSMFVGICIFYAQPNLTVHHAGAHKNDNKMRYGTGQIPIGACLHL